MKIGALQRSMRRRRYADGGGVDPSDDDSIGMYSALSQSAPSDLMGRDGQPIEPPIPPDQQDGALSRSAAQPQQQSGDPDAAAKIARLQQARDVLASLQSGGGGGGYSNLPLLAAAGAMLAPTRTGGFAESLGNAFSSGAATAEQQRQLQEQTALRRAQMDQNAIYRQQMAQVAQQRADTGDRRADTYDAVNAARVQQLQAAASLAMAKAVGSLGGHATAGDNEAAAIGDLVSQGYTKSDAYAAVHGASRWSYVGTDPDGKPIMLDSKTGQTQVGTTALGIKPLDQAKIDTRLKAIQNTDDYRQQLLALRQQGLDDFTAGNIMNNASRLMAADPTGKLTASEAVRQQLAGRSIAAPAAPAPRPGIGSGAPAQAAPPGAASASNPGTPDPLAAARSAISRGAPRDAVIKRLQDNGIDPSGL